MSEIFEGVVIRVPAKVVESVIANLNTDLEFGLFGLSGQLSILYRNDAREVAEFSNTTNWLAEKLSRPLAQTLLVRYDSRIGHRSSVLYVNGALKREFGMKDELFVPLNEDGEPILTAPRLRFTELNPEEEYETIENAIQLGLTELGDGNWSDIKKWIGRT